MDQLGKVLAGARKKKNMTQGDVAKKMKWVSASVYGQLENGCRVGTGYKRVPQKGVLVRLSKMLKTPYKTLAEAAIERLVDNKRMTYFGKGK